MQIKKSINKNEHVKWDTYPTFWLMDQSGDGFVSKVEVDKLLLAAGFSAEQTEKFFKHVDVNSDGQLSLDEFIKGLQE